jgi:dephospho-CoA kinase
LKTIGITGGIGSGKTLVCSVFQSLGIPIFHADDVGKELYHRKPELTQLIADQLDNALMVNGKLNLAALAALVFNNDDALKKLNGIVHPFVAEEFMLWKKRQHSKYVIREAAILFESNSAKDCDQVVLVTADQHERIRRVKQRSHLSEVQIRARMDKQWTDDQKRKLADYEIENSGQKLILPAIYQLHQLFMV